MRELSENEHYSIAFEPRDWAFLFRVEIHPTKYQLQILCFKFIYWR